MLQRLTQPFVLLLASLIASGAFVSASAETYSFNPDGCDYTVEFPRQPQAATESVHGFDDVPGAELIGAGGYLRANCIDAAGFGPVNVIPYYHDRSLLLAVLQTYAEQTGLSNAIYSHELTDLEYRAAVRGDKLIDETQATYELVLYVSHRSALILEVAYPTEHFPSATISSFLKSVSYRKPPITPPPENSDFVRVHLPFNVSLDAPHGWMYMNRMMKSQMNYIEDGVLDLREYPLANKEKTILISAIAWPFGAYASFGITRYSTPLGDPDDIRNMNPQELDKIRQEFEAEVRQSLSENDFSFLETTDLHIGEVDGWPAIVFSYRYSGAGGPVFVQDIRIIRKTDWIKTDFDFQENNRAEREPMLEHIKNSIRVR